MIQSQKVLAVIPARGGSKGLPGKNIIDLAGKPLIAHTIKAAKQSRYIDRCIVTTDDDAIADAAREHGAEVPFKRPAYLAEDVTHTPPVIEHAVQFLESVGDRYDIIVTLQPTSPLRKPEHIDEALEKLVGSSAESVVSVKPSEYPPYWMVTLGEGGACSFVQDSVDYFKKERQELTPTYQINGAVYATRREALRRGLIITHPFDAMEMDAVSSMDIDTQEDLDRVREAVGAIHESPGEKIVEEVVLQDDRGPYFYTGKKICLRAVEKEDYTEHFYSWANEPDFHRYLSHGIRPASKRRMEELYEALMKKDNVIFTILDKTNNEPVGIIGLHHLSWQIRSAEYTIHIKKSFWGTGVAGEATDYILKHAFETLGMNKVWLGGNASQQRAIRFYEKKGFVREGILRDEIFREGRFHDSVKMSIRASEYGALSANHR